MSNLDKVESYDDLSHKQWIAVGTKLGGVGIVKAILKGQAEIEIRPIQFLGPAQRFVFTNTQEESFKPASLADNKHVWASPDFHEFILAVSDSAKVVDLTGHSFGYKDLMWPNRIPGNKTIRSELPRSHVFQDTGTFLCFLAELLRVNVRTTYTQSQTSPIISRLASNVFYVKGLGRATYCVSVRWHNLDEQWHLTAYQLDFEPWSYGDRVFYTPFD